MLRSVCFKNFVKFKEKHNLHFQGSGPFIFIGENSSGKSSVLEGIRRCLHSELSTSFSRPFQTNDYYYFICKFETGKDKSVICGILRLPGEKDERYKFALTQQKDVINDFCADLFVSPGNGENSKVQEIQPELWPLPEFIEAVFDRGKGTAKKIENFMQRAFASCKSEAVNRETQCQKLLGTLSNEIVFTFPLRSIGPLQWSKSDRIKSSMKDENYIEAERRCEVIRYFLTHKDLFDTKLENDIFEEVTKQSKKYKFTLTELNDNIQHLLLNGEKYSLLKTPEGILEAKIFSILISGKLFQTIILEEPERGMHPQFIARMVHIINRMGKRVILTTHNPSLITPWTFTDCFVFKRKDDRTYTIYSGSSIVEEKGLSLKSLRILTSDHLSDILFSQRVLFCEGPSDYLFLTELKRAILSEREEKYKMFQKLDFRKVKESLREITFLKMKGAGNTVLCYDFCSSLDLKVQFLLDADQKNEKELAKLKSFIFFWPDGNLEDMVIKMSDSNEKLKTDLSKENVDLTKLTKPKSSKLFLDPKISVDNFQNSVRLILDNCEPTDDVATEPKRNDSVAKFMRFLYE